MPLHILALLVVGGLAVIIGAVHFSGGSEKVPPLTRNKAMQRFHQDHQMFTVGECIVANDGRTALLFDNEGLDCGLVIQRGDKLVTRRVSADLLSLIEKIPDGLQLSFEDFTLPHVMIALDADDVRDDMFRRLSNIENGAV